MSNIIKSRFVYLNDGEKKFIDTNEKSEKYRVIHLEHNKNFKSYEEELAVTKDGTLENSFVGGLSATVIESEIECSNEYSKEMYNQIIEKANEEASMILQTAKLEAENIIKILYEEASNRGYKDGIEKGKHEILIEKTRLESLKTELQNEYEDKVLTLEPEFAKLVTLYVEKLTGICVEGEKEVIKYLIHNAMTSAEPSKQFIIKVSKDDYDNVVDYKEEIEELVLNGTIVEIMRGNDLIKNQCMIETDTSVIDCSFDVMLSGLIRDIKLLSSNNYIESKSE